MTSTLIKLTPTQWEIINHRLSLDDCISDVLGNYHSPESVWTPEEVQDCAFQLYGKIEKSQEIDFSILSDLQKEILIECLEGSTFFSDAEDQVTLGRLTRSKLSRWHKAADALEQALSTPKRRVLCNRS